MKEEKAKILIVDDESNIRHLYSAILSKDNYNISQAAEGDTAIKMLKKEHFDLVISDLHMHGLGGIEVLKAAKVKDPLIQVLILTGKGSINTAVQAMILGAFEYLTKPVDVETFRIKVKNALEQRKLQFLLQEQQLEIDEHHAMIERDLRLAAQVQASLVPSLIDNDHVTIGVAYRPTIGVGGDFVDIYYDEDGKVYLSIIDVTGHGITAALLVNRVCSEIRKLVREKRQPCDILYMVNNFFYESFSSTGMFLTMMSMLVNLNEKEIIYSGSAHPAALVWHAQENRFIKLDSQNTIIGFEKSPENGYLEDRLEISLRDKIVLYTDGIIEAENSKQEPLGLGGFLNILNKHINKTVNDAVAGIVKDIQTFSKKNKDDIYLVMAELK